MKKQLLLTLIFVLGVLNISAYSQAGFTCNEAIPITALPYTTTDNTANYGDTYDVIQPTGCVTTSGNYMGGNDVFYSYTPNTNEAINIRMTPLAGWSGIFVYDGCSNVGVNCVAGVANSSTAMREIPSLNVLGGHTYIITISTYPSPQTVGYTLQIQNISCGTPTLVSSTNIATNSVSLTWENSSASSWEVFATPCGTPAPTATSVGIATTTNSIEITGLNPSTCYNFYVRANCSSTDNSFWTSPTIITTLAITPPAPVCGGQFMDNGGSANYANSSDNTYTICPTVPGDVVTVNFVSFDTEASWDGLYVFNGNSISAPQIASSNPAGNVPGGLAGSYWGTSIPDFTSSSPDGCLTFRFRSDSSVNRPGWVANVVCGPMPTCPKPNNVTITNINYSGATIGWTEVASATQWEVLILPATDPAPTATVTGVLTSTNPYTASGLTSGTAYKAYVKAVCSGTDSSLWSLAGSFSTTLCTAPTSLVVTGLTTDSANLGWSQTGGATQWEIIVLPFGSPAPTPTTTGTLVSSSPYTATGLVVGNNYSFYVRTICSTDGISSWTGPLTFSPIQYLPPLVTNSTLYTNEQLVTEVLVNNPCISISNVTSSTGTNFGTTANGIGYFTNTNPTFPISSGIILSTGSAINAPGPNTSILSDGNTSWPGDTELENIITTATGNVMNSFNATKLEFDFTSLNEFMSFNFLFASDEYGTFQCQYSDAFAFLLTDLETGITTNLAVVPGTTTPISVVTIRDMEFNTGCPSENPDFFDTYFTGGTNYSSATNFNGQTAEMTASSAILPNHPYHIKLVVADRSDSAFDSAVFIKAGSFTSGPPECSDKIELVAFIDDNGNGVKDSGESNFTYGSFVYQQNNAGDITNISSPIGSYTIYDAVSSNTYDFSYSVNSEYASYFSAGTTTYNDFNIPVGSGTQVLYFPVTLTQGYNDVSIFIIPISAPRPGFNYTNKVVYKNLGITPTSGTINFVKDAQVTIANVTQPGIVSNATGFSYDFTNLIPYETRSFYVSMNVPAIPTVNLGDVLTNSATISAPANDINLSNNSFSNSQIVVASYDPNDKSEAHGDKIVYNQFSQGDYLYYTIHFQNNGTANAISVRVEDLLDSRLDETSIRMVSASHNYIMQRVNNQIVWKFDYIQLPPAIQNADDSKGYVFFKIKLKPGFAVGDIIPNTAQIYFDENPAIVTNTFNTEFVAALANISFNDQNLFIFPNPANNFVQISLQNTVETIQNIAVYDVLGKTIKTVNNISEKQFTLDVSELSKGVYLLELTTENGLKKTKKLVIE